MRGIAVSGIAAGGVAFRALATGALAAGAAAIGALAIGEHPAGRGGSSPVRMHGELFQAHPGQYDVKGQWEMAIDEKVVACVRDASAGLGSVWAGLCVLLARFFP